MAAEQSTTAYKEVHLPEEVDADVIRALGEEALRRYNAQGRVLFARIAGSFQAVCNDVLKVMVRS